MTTSSASYNRDFIHSRTVARLEQPPSLEEIRRQAKEAWTSQIENETSYQDHYAEKFSKVGEFTASRPTSADRKNKPHPKQ